MDLTDNLEYVFNAELTRRLLIRYFTERGFKENFDKKVYPPLLQDIAESIPELGGKLELEPFSVEMDPTSGFARMGWNLFVLGNQRMYLGETEHAELAELAKQLDSDVPIVTEGEQPFRQARTARDIVNWITRVLGTRDAGLIRYEQTDQQEMQSMGATSSSSMFERPKAIRPEGAQSP